MLMKIIGREREQRLIEEYIQSEKPELIAVYGRRRVGKTSYANSLMTSSISTSRDHSRHQEEFSSIYFRRVFSAILERN